MNLRYLLVDVGGGGSFGSQTWEQIRALVGPEGPDRVPLMPAMHAAGWVNDCGHLAPDEYPRNVVGSVLLGCMGAVQQPYAGRVVITGWCAEATQYGDLEVVGLSDAQVSALTWLVSDIRRVLGYEPGKPTGTRNPVWIQAVSAFAEQVRSGPTPQARILTDPAEVLAFLRGQGGV